jgi:hypothetical protein
MILYNSAQFVHKQLSLRCIFMICCLFTLTFQSCVPLSTNGKSIQRRFTEYAVFEENIPSFELRVHCIHLWVRSHRWHAKECDVREPATAFPKHLGLSRY